MRKFKKLTLTLALLLTAVTGAWAQETVTVTPVTGQTNKWTFTMPAFNVELTPIYAPEFTATFKAGNSNTIQGGKATVTVTESGATEGTQVTLDENGKLTPLYEGQTITMTAAAGYKFKSVEAKKVAAIDYSTAQLGDLFYSDGTFSTTLEAGKTPIGVIAYLDQEGTDDDEICEKSNGAGHGLVLCLKNAASAIAWSTETYSQAYTGNAFVTDVEGLKRLEGVSGYSATVALASATDASTVYPAVYQARNYTGLTAPTGTTGWFLPSAQQWVKMIEGLGGLSDGAPSLGNWFDTSHTAADKWEAALQKAGSGNYDSMTSAYLFYWSSSEKSASNAVSLGVDATNTDHGFGWGLRLKDGTNEKYRVRSVLAF